MANDLVARPAGPVRRADSVVDRWLKAWNPYDPSKLADRGLQPIQIEESKVRKKGTWYVLIAVGAFLVWALTAPIGSGTPLPGTVVVSGYRKAVQHPTGGVVSEVRVTEGSKVRQGDILIRINPLETEATVANLEQEYINLLVIESRATAELMGRPIVWDPALSGLDPQRVAQAKAVQQRFYTTRQAQFGEQVSALQSQISGLNGAMSSHRVQLGTLDQELRNVQELAREGFVPKAQVNTTLRTKVEQEAALGTAAAQIGKTRSEIAGVRSSFLSEVAKELAEIQKTRDTVATKLQAARFAQSLSAIRAPVSGTVVGLKVYTQGGVIAGGEVLMEIVPTEGKLILETKVPPSSIDSVSAGKPVDIRFTAFNQSTTPVLQGWVKSVGVDKLKAKPGEELREGEDYYLAQVETTPAELAKLGGQKLQPGMPADVIVKSGERTFMSYLLKPLTDKLAKAFQD